MLKLFQITEKINRNDGDSFYDQIHIFANDEAEATAFAQSQCYVDEDGSCEIDSCEYLRDIKPDEIEMGISEGTGQSATNGTSEFWP